MVELWLFIVVCAITPPLYLRQLGFFFFFLTHSIALKTESRTTKVSVFYHLFHQLLTPLETSINIQCVCLKLNFYFALLSIDSYIQRVSGSGAGFKV